MLMTGFELQTTGLEVAILPPIPQPVQNYFLKLLSKTLLLRRLVGN